MKLLKPVAASALGIGGANAYVLLLPFCPPTFPALQSVCGNYYSLSAIKTHKPDLNVHLRSKND